MRVNYQQPLQESGRCCTFEFDTSGGPIIGKNTKESSSLHKYFIEVFCISILHMQNRPDQVPGGCGDLKKIISSADLQA